MHAARLRLSPVCGGWALAGGLSVPALTLALGYLPTSPLVALATVVAGAGVVAGAALAALGRGDAVREFARAWAIAYTSGVLVYLTGLELAWPQPDTAVIVTPDGSGGLTSGQEMFLLLFSVGLTLLLGAALNESHRTARGSRLQGVAAAVAAWGMAMLPLPILFVLGVYATSMLGNTFRFGDEIPAHLFGLVCSGVVMGTVAGGIAEAILHGVQSPPC